MQRLTFVITIGRNVGDTPLSDDEWRRYASDVEFTINDLGTTELLLCPKFSINGPEGVRGQWQGQSEDSAVFLGFIDSEYSARYLTILLNELREKYEQDSIGFLLLPGTNHVIAGV